MTLHDPEIALKATEQPDATPLVVIDRVSRAYRKGKVAVPVLERHAMTIAAGEMLALVGASGCGKTTLLNLIGGADRPDAGEITVGETRITSLSDGALTDWRGRNVGFIFQFYNLLPALSARANVELPLLIHDLRAAERRARVDNALNLVGLEDRADHRPEEMSGGQQQRVAIARALVTDADLLLCDEPTGDLDQDSATRIMELLSLLNEEFGKTIVVVTHDPNVAAYAARTVRLTRPEAV
ncbi:ABC transporter ATP-binding protein [Roseivivax halodurans JCM 10272]|uniref:ABC transporter ATP-binding protein n=1 Tax=Roseivivax halodurans JCM 10272 TaxID=1449350 RepID=X7ECQ2_9RHOB|nr:ABC transporter ATP-binding protein [Roseivivax halodurans]ETX12956.1 ABC transporter ATP-binding protein [Roseivivax halodurans JCM 10272]